MPTAAMARLVHHLARTRATDQLSDADLLARFASNRDPAAFEALIHRHGPRVLAACRKVLTDPADAEDAVQATFVVLMRRPQAIRRPDALGAWLFGVAHRIALRARANRRRREQAPLPAPPATAGPPDLAWPEACAILHEELDRLPDHVRRPLLLCYLEGKTRDEAAAELGRTVPSIKAALEKGRAVLRTRLARRGVSLSAGLLAAVVAPVAGALPIGLARRTVQVAATPSPVVVALVRGTGSAFPWPRSVGVAMAASILAVGVALGMSGQPKADPPAKSAPAAKAKPTRDDEVSDVLKYAGTVTGPDGKPVAGAKLWLTLTGSTTLRASGESKPDGRFAFDLKRSELPAGCFYEDGRRLWDPGTVLATAPGRPVAWGHSSVDPGYSIPIQFQTAAPIDGTIHNLEGQPVAGATVRVVGMYRPKGEGDDLARFADAVADGKLDQYRIYEHLNTFEGDDLRDGALNPLCPPVTTAKDGTFTLKTLGSERIALLRIEGEGIETEDVMVMTRAGKSVVPVVPKGLVGGGDFRLSQPVTLQGRYAVHGSKFTHTVAPGRTVAGVVRDLDTGKPVPGAVISLTSTGTARAPLKEHHWVKADAAGKYRFIGLPMAPRCMVRVAGPADEPYLAADVEVPHPAGVDPVTVDVKLKRGLWASVRLIDKTDKSAVNGQVEYFVRADNPHLKDVPTPVFTRSRKVRLGEPYRVAVLPGPGYLAVRMSWQHPFISLTSPRAAPIATLPYGLRAQKYLAHVKIDPPKDSTGEQVEIGLTRGQDE